MEEKVMIILYNTLTRQKETFRPLIEGKVGIYVCGITAYDLCHIGHARSAIVFDVIVRYLRFRGYEVTYVKNFTDIDDKIIKRAQAEGKDVATLAEHFIAEHDRDMEALGVLTPDHTPRATAHISDMVALIEKLLARGMAYTIDGDVFFSVEKFPTYGKLSGRTLADMLAGARVEVNERKKNPLDFALWKSSKEGEPWWESPWGRGRPGWHIECSVMSQKYLGETFDIHGGGEDLIFPHHENEIAQAQGATGKPLANYWLHNGFIRVNSEKMSKSLGNFFTIRDLLKHFHPEVLRLFILQTHYRSPIDFTETSLREARQALNRLYGAAALLEEISPPMHILPPSPLPPKEAEVLERLTESKDEFLAAMDDDINTARSLASLFDMARTINAYLSGRPTVKERATLYTLGQAEKYLKELGGVLGLLKESPRSYFAADRKREVAKRGLNEKDIERLIAERTEARKQKDWTKADEIRTHLRKMGIEIKDTPAGTTWEVS